MMAAATDLTSLHDRAADAAFYAAVNELANAAKDDLKALRDTYGGDETVAAAAAHVLDRRLNNVA